MSEEKKGEKGIGKGCVFPRPPMPCDENGFVAAIVSAFMAGVAATIGILHLFKKD